MTLEARISALITAIGTDVKSILTRVLPSGGTAGQALIKSSATNYAVEWGSPSATNPYPRVKTMQAAGGGGTGLSNNFGGSTTALGTATGRAYANTNILTRQPRVGYVGTATAGNSANVRTTATHFNLAKPAKYVLIYNAADAATVANARSFNGFYATNPIVSSNPSTFLNCFGLGHDSGEANLSIIHNDGSGTATKVALGSNFPANTLSADLYEFTWETSAIGTSIAYTVENLSTGNSISGTITTDLPAAGTGLFLHIWRENGSTALAVGIDFSSFDMFSAY